jgi:hypothetical protein
MLRLWSLLSRVSSRILLAAFTILIWSIANPVPTLAQDGPKNGILADGNALVTGFSGAQPPAKIAPGVDPADKTYIDLSGPSARVIDLQAPGEAPKDQVLQAAKPFTVIAGQVGQVFGVAIDNASPPNIYVAATSVYGLPIVVPDKDGDGLPDRVKEGAPNASFMPGLFGPADQQGGPGSIWRIDGSSGEVHLFANVTLDGAVNPGPALGGLAFDPASQTLLVADRSTGMIHAFDLTGKERGHYDHGVQGRQAAGLPPVPFDPSKRLDITNAQFQSAKPSTWGYAPPARLIFGLAVHDGRLYYAVAEGLQIWSVAIAKDGAFGNDARIEVTVPPGQGASEISKIAFDDQGRMLLAERMAPSGAYDFAALTQGGGRVLRFEPSGGAGQGWQPAAGDPEWGLDASRHGNGGIAVGYGYDATFRRDAASCGGSVWWTGEQLSPGGPDAVNGLQGRPEGAVAGWLIDFDDRLDDPQSRGHMGDVAIFRSCAGPGAPPELATREGAPQPGEAGAPTEPEPLPEGVWPGPWGPWPVGPWPDGGPPPPPPICPAGTQLAQGGPTSGPRQCCPIVGGVTTTPGFNGQCQSHCANGSLVPKDNLTCELGFQAGHGPSGGPILGAGGPGALICWNGQPPVKIPPGFPGTSLLHNKCPKPPLAQCQAGFQLQYGPPTPGWEWSNAHCVPTPAQLLCAPGQQVGGNGTCQNLCPGGQRAFPVNRCCLNGTAPNAQGQCNPGIFVPPLWYLDYLATGTGQCVVPPGNPAACSYYEFTITGRQRFGRGSLTQRITLPPGSDFPEARIVRGSKYCPSSAWTCSKSGNGFICSAENCGLEPGDQVVLRLEGKVAPNLTEPPPTPIEKTACGVLEWQAMPGPGAATTVQPGVAAGTTAQPQRQAAAEIAGLLATPSRRACWTIQVVGERPATVSCPTNYVATVDGQCCLRSQMTDRGVCCPAGQRPDARRQTCVPVSAPVVTVPTPPEIERHPCPSGQRWNDRRHRCVPAPTVRECPVGQHWDDRRHRCVSAPTVRECPAGQHWDDRRHRCVPAPTVRECPAGQHWDDRRHRCVSAPTVHKCPSGHHWNGRRCVPDVVRHQCPAGHRWNGRRCVPERPRHEQRRREPHRDSSTRRPSRSSN